MKVSAELKELSGHLDEETIDRIINGTAQKKKKPKAVKIEHELYSRFFPEGTKSDEIEEIIIRALEIYFEQQKG